jgi:hypothetical protein
MTPLVPPFAEPPVFFFTGAASSSPQAAANKTVPPSKARVTGALSCLIIE